MGSSNRAAIAARASAQAASSSAIAASRPRASPRASGLLKVLRRLRHAPGANASGRALKRMRRRRGTSRLGTDDALKHQRGLADENLQNLAFKAAIAERHAPEVIRIDDRRLLLKIRHGQKARFDA